MVVQLEVTSSSVEETVALGARLGAVLQVHDFVALEGELGAGKTRFAEGIARGLGVDANERIPSPTFTLVNEHEGRLPLIHADLYRLTSPAELFAIGWSDYLGREAVIVVEWLSNIGAEVASAPADRIEIAISVLDEQRRLATLRATGPRSEERLAALRGA